MINPTHIINFEEDAVVELVETGEKSKSVERIATKRWDRLDYVPPRFDEECEYIQIYETPGHSVIIKEKHIQHIEEISSRKDMQ